MCRKKKSCLIGDQSRFGGICKSNLLIVPSKPIACVIRGSSWHLRTPAAGMASSPALTIVGPDIEKAKGNGKAEKDMYKNFPLIGVEPVMFLYTAGFRIIYVVEEAFFLYKACAVDLGYPEHICKNITQVAYQNYSTQAQIKVAAFQQYNNAGLLVLPAVLIIFLGAWSDKVGRKIPLLLGLFGFFIHAFMMAIISIKDNWNLMSVVYGATLPGSLTGRDWTIYMTCFSYLSDTTSPQQRTIRSTILAMAYLVPIPLGVALGSYLYNGPFQGSFFSVFLTASAVLAISMIYTLIFIPWNTFKPKNIERKACSFEPIIDTFNTLIQRRTGRKRLLIFLALIVIGFSAITKDESKIVQLYAFWKFHWTVKSYGFFKEFESSAYIVGLLIFAPLIQKIGKLQDAYIMILGALSYFISRVIWVFFHSTIWIYIGAAFSTIGPIISPVGRSVVSKVVDVSERGKMFALVGVFELLVRFLASIGYSQVYMNTIKTGFPEAFYIVTLLCNGAIIWISLYIHFSILGRKNIDTETEDKYIKEGKENKAFEEEKGREHNGEDSDKKNFGEENKNKNMEEECQKKNFGGENEQKNSEERCEKKNIGEESEKTRIREENEKKNSEEGCDTKNIGEETVKKSIGEEDEKNNIEDGCEKKYVVEENEKNNIGQESEKTSIGLEDEKKSNEERCETTNIGEESIKTSIGLEDEKKSNEERCETKNIGEESIKKSIGEKDEKKNSEEGCKKKNSEEGCEKKNIGEVSVKKSIGEEDEKNSEEDCGKKYVGEENEKKNIGEESVKKSIGEEDVKKNSEEGCEKKYVGEENEKINIGEGDEKNSEEGCEKKNVREEN